MVPNKWMKLRIFMKKTEYRRIQTQDLQQGAGRANLWTTDTAQSEKGGKMCFKRGDVETYQGSFEIPDVRSVFFLFFESFFIQNIPLFHVSLQRRKRQRRRQRRQTTTTWAATTSLTATTTTTTTTSSKTTTKVGPKQNSFHVGNFQTGTFKCLSFDLASGCNRIPREKLKFKVRGISYKEIRSWWSDFLFVLYS